MLIVLHLVQNIRFEKHLENIFEKRERKTGYIALWVKAYRASRN